MTYVPNKWITYILTISPFDNPWQPQQTNKYMREVINHSTYIHLLNIIKSILTQTLEKLCKKRVHSKEDFDNLYFWNTLNKTHQSILVWDKNNRLHTIYKKLVYKDRKETTHIRVGERNIHQHIKKKKYNACKYGHKTDVQEKWGKHSL